MSMRKSFFPMLTAFQTGYFTNMTGVLNHITTHEQVTITQVFIGEKVYLESSAKIQTK